MPGTDPHPLLTPVAAHFDRFRNLVGATEATDRQGQGMELNQAYAWIVEVLCRIKPCNKVMYVGNGGSAAIASHLAIDVSRNGGIPALCFNDGAALTCMANDFGYDQVFARQLAMHALQGDVLIAISSSGQSPNILNAVRVANERGCHLITLSGFRPDNPLRQLGDINLFVADTHYGHVEVSHLILAHSMLDLYIEATASSGVKI